MDKTWPDDAVNSSLHIYERNDKKLELLAWITSEENGTSKKCIEPHTNTRTIAKKTNINTYVAIDIEKNALTATMSKCDEVKCSLSPNYNNMNLYIITTIQRYNYDNIYTL